MDSSHENYKQLCPEHGQILEQHYDWLSTLPTDILHHILSFLDATEVVKTSLLSRKWRYIWTSVPRLNFDFRGFWKQGHCLFLTYDACLLKFYEFVKWALIIRDTSPIYKLQLLCDYYEDDQLKLLLSLSAMSNVQELDLLVGYELPRCPFIRGPSEPVLGIRQNCNGLVNLQSLSAIGNLKTLQLVNVRFLHADITEKLFSDCGILENLSIECCSFQMINVLHISAHKLRKLNFVNKDPKGCRGHQCIFEGELKVHTPNLVSFCYIGPLCQPFEFSSDMPFLNHALLKFPLRIYVREVSQKLGTIVSDIHCAKKLSLCEEFTRYFSLGRSRCKFNYLRCLKLRMACIPYQIEGLINLLKLSPNLEVLSIELHILCWYYGVIGNFWKSREEDVPCLANHLKEIEISDFHDSPHALGFVNFFLQNGKSLQKMKIIQNKERMIDQKELSALRAVQLASEAISVSVFSFSASGETELLQFIYEKPKGNVRKQTKRLEIKSKRSMRIAALKSGGSSRSRWRLKRRMSNI